jgi:predicted nucleotidyltransferase
MDAGQSHLPEALRVIVERFVAACQADERVVAAFLVGSYARGTADAYSDLDLRLVIADEAYQDFVAGRAAFGRSLGAPAFLEDFDFPDYVFLIFPDGAEVELALSRESAIGHIFDQPYRVLLDRKGFPAGAAPPRRGPAQARPAAQAEQIETLRRQVYWFWHDLSHFITAMARGQLWWAYGQLEALRRYAVNLARLRHDFSDAGVGEEAYFKVEHALPAEQLAPLQATVCPLEAGAMLQAARAIVHFYQEVAPPLARTHGITYPVDLERAMSDRLREVTSGQVVTPRAGS